MNDDRFDLDERHETDQPEPAEDLFHTQQPPQAPTGSAPQDIPASPEPLPAPEPKPERKRRAPGSAMKAAMLTLSVIVLIVASALVFTQDTPERPKLGDLYAPPVQSSPQPSSDPEAPTFDFGDTVSGVNQLPAYTQQSDFRMTLAALPTGEALPLTEIYRQCAPGVVAITTRVDAYTGYWGSGIIMSPDGYIITNAHILDGASAVTVTLFDDSEYDAQLVGSDSQSDLAVLKIDAEGLAPMEFGDSSQLEVGEDVVAIGNPLGEELRGTMTNGILSAINRDILSNGHTMTLLQTNAAINEGNSGGPLINRYGQVIGITNMKMMSAYTSIEGIGFAIPTTVMKDIADQLLENGRVSGRPGIGITIGALSDADRQAASLPAGLYVDAVNEQSDAYAKGVRAGDVLTAVNGEAVRSNADVNAVKDTLQVGDTMTLTLYRDGESFEVEIELMDMSVLF